MTTLTYRAAGFTDDIVECEVCGKTELKGTVRLEVVDADGNIEDEIYAGVICAARRSGRRTTSIRGEARAAEKAKSDALIKHLHARHAAVMAAGDRVLARLGLERTYRTAKQAAADPEYIAELAAWDAEHPEPPKPARAWHTR